MKPAPEASPCDHQRLNRFLLGEISPEETEIVEQHLTKCSSCAAELELSAVGESSWHDVVSLLKPDKYDGPASLSTVSDVFPKYSFASIRAASQTVEIVTREIRGWLDPTDDPGMLGRFAGYEIVGIIGHGGMGIVLKGFENALNRFVAIKTLAPRLATNEAARKRFAREAQAAAAVLHDNVVAIHRVDEHHGLPFLVMPYNPRISLQKRIDEEGPLPLEAVLRIGAQISAGLAAAHQQGLVHRDIKPANILLERGVERVTITDFGLARAVDDASVTRTGIIAGTPQYMSPEQAQGKPLDARSDLFSLGSVMYTMITGHPPFSGTAGFEIIERITTEDARPLCEVAPGRPAWLEMLVTRLHARSPGDRIESAAESERLLEQCLSHLQDPVRTPLPPELTPIAKSQPLISRRRNWALLGTGVFMLVAMAFALRQPTEQVGTPTIQESREAGVAGKPVEDATADVRADVAVDVDLNWGVDESAILEAETLSDLLAAEVEEFLQRSEGDDPL